MTVRKIIREINSTAGAKQNKRFLRLVVSGNWDDEPQHEAAPEYGDFIA